MIRSAPVHVWLPGQVNPTFVGEFTHDSSSRSGQFQYASPYLAERHPALAPDMPLRQKALHIMGGSGIFPLFLDAGPDAWGRNVLARSLEREVDEFEALTLCPLDGVGNIALGEITAEREAVLSVEAFVELLHELEQGRKATTDLEDRVLDAVQNGTSLGGTKPKLTLTRDGVQYLAKFPEPGDAPHLPHVECAMLKLADACGIRASEAHVWPVPEGKRTALLVKRFDRETLPTGVARKGYVSAQALLRLDMLSQEKSDVLFYATLGFTPAVLKKSYVAFAGDMARWCGGQSVHREERRELWRRIVFNLLIGNGDDHPRNHGMICAEMAQQQWRLSPAFDLVTHPIARQEPVLAMAYRYVKPARRGRSQAAARLVWKASVEDIVAAAMENYAYDEVEAGEYLQFAAATVATRWHEFLAAEGMPDAEIGRYKSTFNCGWALSV